MLLNFGSTQIWAQMAIWPFPLMRSVISRFDIRRSYVGHKALCVPPSQPDTHPRPCALAYRYHAE